ncbi:TonB-dependent receptor domain-containing protein [Marinobacter sp. F4216]|uniref:TonB-dependent receptor domain-containing protein n=1 Tax=Marinobacter sp. F4216 TaxID=2874281 RepID=UPI001CC02514|nr:TonB-dependent receptor [Marinobacter sp. F4216]MBZ2169731.1 TonB-dependent receptor [Marinobacter sp. F4216]
MLSIKTGLSHTFPGAVLLFSIPVSLVSADTSTTTSADSDVSGMDPIVITATLGPKTVGESLSSVTVIDREAIQRQQPKEFREVIESQPGVNVTSNGAFGKQTSVFLRGHSSDASVLLVDGIRIRSATVGGPAWQYLPPQLIDRIEIVRGGRSSLYGADAVGGVVQAFTLPAQEGRGAWFEAGAGNFNSQQNGAGASSVESDYRLNAGINHFQSDGAPVISGGEDKGYDNTSAVLGGSHRFSNGVTAGFTFLGAEGNTEYEGGEEDFRFQTAGVNLDVPVNRHWRVAGQLSDARDELEDFSSFPGTFNTQTRSSRLENWFSAGTHEFVLGAEYLVDRVDSSVDYDESSRSNTGVFSQALMNFGPLNVHLSLRNDDNEAYGNETTWGAGLGYELDRQHRVRMSAGTSFKAPSFNDLYFPGFGNPDLEPEQAKSYEVGVEGRYSEWFWDVAAFHSDVDDLSLPSQDAADSVPEARLRGVELSGGWQQAGWSLSAAGTFGDYENAATGEQLIRRAENILRLDVDRELGKWVLGTTLRAESERYEELFGVGRQRIAGFGVWDLRASRVFAPGWLAALSVDNVLDREYTTAKRFDNTDFISAGRSVFLSVRYDWRQ